MGQGSSAISSIVLMVLLILMIYFMMIRPQRRKEKADREMREALKVGDEIITIGGVVGKIEKITERTVIVSTGGAARNKIEFVKTAIGSVNNKSDADVSEEKLKESAPEPEKAPDRDKKVTPKKLSRKSDDDAQ